MAEFAWIDCGNGRQVYRKVREKVAARSGLPAPMIISDTIDPLQHPVDGKFYSSKSTFSKITRQAGFIEMGNDPARLRPQKPRPERKGIRETLERAKARTSA